MARTPLPKRNRCTLRETMMMMMGRTEYYANRLETVFAASCISL